MVLESASLVSFFCPVVSKTKKAVCVTFLLDAQHKSVEKKPAIGLCSQVMRLTGYHHLYVWHSDDRMEQSTRRGRSF